MEQIEIKSLSLAQLKNIVTEMGEKAFRAKQIYEWLHQKQAESFDEMSNLSAAFREKLKERCVLTTLKMLEVQTSKIDGTQKYLFALPDGNVVESVLMKYKHGNSVCISSQVGCKMGCRFCASTIGGWTRNLLPSEMLEQIYRIQKLSGERVSNVVVMGTGEPLDNYENLLQFIIRKQGSRPCSRSAYQPAKSHGIYLWNCTENVCAGRGEFTDYTGNFSSCF